MTTTRPLPSPRLFVVVTTLLLLTSLALRDGESAPGPDGSTSQRPTGGEFETEQCIDYGDYFHLRARLDTPGQGEAVAVSGRYAYLVDRLGLRVIDITDPDRPTITGSVSTPGLAHDVAVAGNYAYVAQWSSGLQVIDVTNPTAPVLAGSVDTFAWRVATEGNYAYLASLDLGLQIVDIADPNSPFIVGSVPLQGISPHARDVDVSGNHAYVAGLSDSSVLQVFDVADPSAPVVVGSLDTGGFGRAVTVSGGFAYVGTGASIEFRNGIQVVDVKSPADPILVGSFEFDDDALVFVKDIALLGHIAYAACDVGICAFDVSEPDTPRLMGIVANPDLQSGVAISPEHLLAATSLGLGVYAQPSGGLAPLAGALDVISARDVAVSEGDYAYLAAGFPKELQVIDITDLAAPFIAGSVLVPDGAADVAASGSYAYVTNDTGLRVIDVSDPTAPFIEGSLDTPGRGPNDVTVWGSYAYVAADDEGLQVIDISIPGAPFVAGSVALPGFAWGVAACDGYAYVTGQGAFVGLHVIDLASSTSPVLVGSVETWVSPNGVAVDDRHAYVAVNAGLQVADVSNPAAPFITGAENVPRAFGVAVSGRHAYVSNGLGGVQVIDTTDPTSPLLVGAIEVPGISVGLTVSDQHVYVAAGGDNHQDEPGGLRVAWLQCDSVPRDIRIDVRPGSSSNSVNPRSRGVIPVAILGSETFDVAEVDPDSARFGPNGAEPAHSHPGRVQDLNLDGFTDLLIHFRTQDTGIACGDDSVTLTGVTTSDESFEGSDSIRTVGCREGRRLVLAYAPGRCCRRST